MAAPTVIIAEASELPATAETTAAPAVIVEAAAALWWRSREWAATEATTKVGAEATTYVVDLAPHPNAWAYESPRGSAIEPGALVGRG